MNKLNWFQKSGSEDCLFFESWEGLYLSFKYEGSLLPIIGLSEFSLTCKNYVTKLIKEFEDYFKTTEDNKKIKNLNKKIIFILSYYLENCYNRDRDYCRNFYRSLKNTNIFNKSDLKKFGHRQKLANLNKEQIKIIRLIKK